MRLKVTDVRAIPGDSAFLLDDGVTAILYDSGFGFTGDTVAENICKALGARKLDYIFLTHSHYDHALGAACVCVRYPDVKVVAGEYAAAVFARPSARERMREMDRKFARRCGVPEYKDRVDQLRVDIPVKDGDVIHTKTLDFVTVALPGHTKCSIGFYLPAEKLLLSSETLGVYDGGEMVVPSYLVGYEMTLSSIARVENLEIERLLLPHYGLLDREKTKFYLSNCRKSAVETAEAIKGVFERGGTHADAVRYFREKYYRGNITDIYPEDAMLLNTNIMVDLIEKEFLI